MNLIIVISLLFGLQALFGFCIGNNELASSERKNMIPRIGVAIIVVKDGKILLGKRKGAHETGTWGPPGGHLEFGETVEECTIRELAEETGIHPLTIELGPWSQNFMEGGKKHYITLFVFVNSFENEPQVLESDKCEEWSWFEWDQLPSPLFPTVPSLIEKMSLEQLQR